MKIQPVILAGGNGFCLWPLSQKAKPKQFLKYCDNLSSFQNSIIRNSYLGILLIVANIDHKDIIIKQLKEINLQVQIIFECEQKNTATSALAASYYAKNQGFDTIILIPSDHHIDDQVSYKYSLNKAAIATRKYKFGAIGVAPTYSNTNFGYIKTGQKIDEGLYLATKFIEKPDKELTKKLINSTEYFWNSGIYFFDIDYILELVDKYIPVINKKLSTIFNNELCVNNIVKLDKEIYKDLPAISFDKAISEKLQQMALVKANFKCSDLGSWEAIWNLDKDNEYQNNIQGRGKTITYNVHDSYINSDAKKTIAIDLKNIVVIFKNGQLLVADKNSVELVKQVITDNV
ncbi:MAG: mannose-1-phosphate guanylyltransferase [Rickettsiaceae bacterium]